MINTGSATPRLDLLGPILQEGFGSDAFVAAKCLPPLLVTKKIGAIPSFLYSNDQALSIKHAPKTAYQRIQSKLSQNTFACEEAGVEEAISPEDREILGRDGAEFAIGRRLVQTVLRARDSALAANWFSAAGETTFAANLVTAAAVWANAAGKPIDNVLDAKGNIAKQIGVPGNAILMGYGAYLNLCKNAQILSNYRQIYAYGGGDKAGQAARAEIPTDVLAAILGQESVIVAYGTVNTANEGQTASRSFIWPSTYALVFRKSMGGATASEVCLGRTFTYDLANEIGQLATGTLDSERALVLEQYRDENVRADMMRALEYIDMQVLLPTAGALIKSI